MEATPEVAEQPRSLGGFNVMQFRPRVDSRSGPLRYTAAAIGVGLIDPMPATAVLLYIEAVGHRHLPIAAIDYTRIVHAGATLQDIEVARRPQLLLLQSVSSPTGLRAAPADRSATVSPRLAVPGREEPNNQCNPTQISGS